MANALPQPEEPMEIRRILSPTDFSELATRSLEYAVELARRTGAEIVVMYADPFLPPPHFTSDQMDDLVRNLDMHRAAAKKELERYAAENVPSEVPMQTRVIEDTPASAIVKTADEVEADVIVMGTHGRGGVNRFLLGSVAERVLHETSRPLLTVRESSGPAADSPAKPRVLCPVNLSDTARAALDVAVSFSNLLDADLVVLHVAEDDSEKTRAVARDVESWLPPDRLRTSADTLVLEGDAGEKVIDYARTHAIDLIVLGATHRRFGDTSVLGTTAVRITRHAPIPVLTVIS
jgi:nucleotide-binding universal stress UspA family protein